MKFKLAMVVAAVLACGAAKADTVYDVSGAITSVGNNASVTVDYSYILDVGFVPNYGYVFSTEDEQVSGSGSLGNVFTMGNFTYGGAPGSYVPIFDAEGDEIDLTAGGEDIPVVIPTFAQWYKCQLACFTDFLPASEQAHYAGDNGPNPPIAWNAGFNGAAPFTMTQTVTDPVNTPEAPTAILLCAGLLGLVFLRRRPASRTKAL
jgi:hypothetical protein